MAYAAPNLYQPTFENISPIASALKAVGGLQGAMQGGMETQYLPQQLQAGLQQQQQAAQQSGIETKFMPAQLAAEIKNLMSNAGLNQAQAASVTTAYHLLGPEFALDYLKTGLQFPKQMFAGGASGELSGVANRLGQNILGGNFNNIGQFYKNTTPDFSSNLNQSSNVVQQFAKQNNLNEGQIDQLQNGQIVDLGNGRVAQNYNGKIRTGRRQ